MKNSVSFLPSSYQRKYAFFVSGLCLSLCFTLVTFTSGQTSEGKSKIAGTWTWTWKDRLGETHRHVLEIEGANNKYAARELFDDAPAVRVMDLVVNGANIKFKVVRDGRNAEYDGKVSDDGTLNGIVKITSNTGEIEEFIWKAEKRTDIPKK